MPSSIFYLFLLVATLCKSAKASPFLRHARGDSECSGDCRQHTNGCLNREFPKCLVLHGSEF